MRHTSIRLSDRHQELILASGKGPSEVMREALDLYFEEGEADRLKALIQEHEERWHKARHKLSTPPEHVPQVVRDGEAQRAHSVLKEEAHVPPSVRDDGARKRRSPKPPILEDDERRAKLIEMVRTGELTLAEMGERLGGYDKGAVSRAISKLREAGELEG